MAIGPMPIRLCAGVVLLLALAGAFVSPAQATYKDDVGYTALSTQLGTSMPNGTGVGVTQVEALSGGYYRPDVLDSELSGKTFTFKGGNPTAASTHATAVGQDFYGRSHSLAPNITTIDVYKVTTTVGDANSYLFGKLLKAGTTSEPLPETRDVENHSWIGTTDNAAMDQDILRRLDYAIQRDDFVAVVGVNNGSSNTLPNLLCQSYNAIAVGLSSGAHSFGTTTLDGSGRTKPDIVAPHNDLGMLVSYVTPLVGGAAAEIIQVARANSSLNLAASSEAVKAILLAGATKTQFSTWGRTPTAPLDDRYGAGQLNVYNNYHILTAGRQQASASSDVGTAGWDFNASAAPGGTKTYFFDVPATTALKEFSVILTWNRIIVDGTPSDSGTWTSTGTPIMANMDLKLYRASGYSLAAMVDSSVSTVDNVEHIYGTLLPGRYALEVSSGIGSIDYALAWRNVSCTGGDANMDGIVDLQDFGILKASYGITAGALWTQGDFNGDGMIDLQDFGILKANYGSTVPLSPALTAVPEPASASLLLAGLAGLLRRRRAA